MPKNLGTAAEIAHSNENGQKSNKKPFDKKKWRNEKYSNKEKFKRWEERRRIALQRDLNKQLARDGIKINTKNDVNQTKQMSRLKAAQLQYQRKKEEDQRRFEEAKLAKEKKLEKLKEYRAKKAERSRKLNQKTRKGQPLMRGKLELLQEKIQKMIAENKL